MNEINLKLETHKVGQYNVDDMISMFGDRIKDALFTENNKNIGIDAKKMQKIIRKWKFWNKDIRKAYKHYYGIILAPFIIVDEPPILIVDNNNPNKYYNINKKIYSKTKINPKFYNVIKTVKNEKTTK